MTTAEATTVAPPASGATPESGAAPADAGAAPGAAASGAAAPGAAASVGTAPQRASAASVGAAERPSAAWTQRRFEELALQVGTRLQIVIGQGAAQHVYSSSLIGWLDRAYICVRTPVDGRVSARLIEGETLSVRLFAGVHAIRFDSAVARVLSAPLSQLVLTYPASVESLTLRRSPRAPVDLPARVTVDSKNFDGRIHDLSTQGARLAIVAPTLSAGQTCTIAFELPGEGDSTPLQVKTTATVKSLKQPENAGSGASSSAGMLGLQFDSLSAEHGTALRVFVYERLLGAHWKSE